MVKEGPVRNKGELVVKNLIVQMLSWIGLIEDIVYRSARLTPATVFVFQSNMFLLVIHGQDI